MKNLEALYAMVFGESTPENKERSFTECVRYLKDHHPDFTEQFEATYDRDTGDLVRITHTAFQEPKHKMVKDHILIDRHVKMLCQILNREPDEIVYTKSYSMRSQEKVSVLFPGNYTSLSREQVLYYYFHTYLEVSLNNLQRSLLDDVLAQNNEEALRCLIQNHARVALRIIDSMKGYPITSYTYPRNYSFSHVRGLIRDTLEKLLSFLASYFSDFLQPSFSFTPSRPANPEMLERLDTLQRISRELESPWPDIVSEPLEKYRNRCSYPQARYIENYVKELEVFMQAAAHSTKRWILFLWRMNLNSPQFLHFLKRRIKAEQRKIHETSEKRLRLLYYQKLIKQIRPTMPAPYEAATTSLTDHMLTYLSEELTFLEQTDLLQPATGKKKMVKVSVSQLALIARACLESGLIEEDKQELLKSLAFGIRTERQDQISVDNLRNKYYSVDSGTRQSVRKLLKKMIEIIEPNA